eukprot:TRINITY_DN6086_c2_g3_i2.p1 TRINITY_DN6086_c2_g3~~TRINITY_DN6086_c2_g3_i2.p1  ORF type:complete len:291 (+),score=33.60 TRINITY_DN6086_c2_g3_i2:221-1093(+)
MNIRVGMLFKIGVYAFLSIFALNSLIFILSPNEEAREHAQPQSHPRLSVVSVDQPHFMVIGAWKSGTTSLLHYLGEDPRICIAMNEFSFFQEDEKFSRGLEWWKERNHECATSNRTVGMKAASYYASQQVAARVKLTVPRVKLLLLLRNPVGRVHSHWYMHLCKNRTTFNVTEFATRKKEAGLRAGHYAEHIRNWLAMFSKSQIMVMFMEEFFENPDGAMSDVYAFLDMEKPPQGTIDYSRVWGTSTECRRRLGPRPRLQPSERDFLHDYFVDHNIQLSKLLGRPVPLAW